MQTIELTHCDTVYKWIHVSFFKTRSSVITERPQYASCHWIFW